MYMYSDMATSEFVWVCTTGVHCTFTVYTVKYTEVVDLMGMWSLGEVPFTCWVSLVGHEFGVIL